MKALDGFSEGSRGIGVSPAVGTVAAVVATLVVVFAWSKAEKPAAERRGLVEPKFRIWVSTRKFDFAAKLVDNANLHVMLSFDSSTPPRWLVVRRVAARRPVGSACPRH